MTSSEFTAAMATCADIQFLFPHNPKLPRRLMLVTRISGDNSALLLTITDIATAWQIRLDLAKMEAHRNDLGIPKIAWRQFFDMFHTSLQRTGAFTLRFVPETKECHLGVAYIMGKVWQLLNLLCHPVNRIKMWS